MKSKEEEVDLDSLFKGLKQAKNKFLLICFNAIRFVIKTWYIILILIIVGAILGYFSQKNSNPSKEAEVVVRTNFNSGEYTYHALEILAKQSKSKDTLFLQANGFRTDTLEIKDIEITPIVSFKDISANFEDTDRNLDAILRNINFQEVDEERIESFKTSYKYHTISLKLSSAANEQTVTRILNYLNNQRRIKELGKVGKEDLEGQIQMNQNTLRQIDSILVSYSKNQSLPSPSSQIFVVDKNFDISNVLEMKMELQKINQQLKQDFVYADQPIVKLDSRSAVVETKGILTNAILVYPFLLVFLFLFLAWLRHLYRYVKNIAKEQ